MYLIIPDYDYHIVMLGWLVDHSVLNAAMKSDTLIDEDEVECRPEKIPCSILDENVHISLVRCYFTNEAWLVVQDVIAKKKEADVWICGVCHKDLADGQESIICDSCLQWYHFSCVCLTKMPKKKKWFCKNC